jgi:hypothetical protein
MVRSLFWPEYLCLGMLPPVAESVKDAMRFASFVQAIVRLFSANRRNFPGEFLD